jgi:pyridoxamine 5'-phosphate oxidase
MAGHFFCFSKPPEANLGGFCSLSPSPRFVMSSTEPLHESTVDANPFRQFQRWYDEALALAGARELKAEAMILSTSTPDGRPSGRVVLLRGFDERGFVFFTNYESRKGQELAANPYAALVFFWDALERQVRVEGHVERTSAEESDAYFQGRPRDSCLSAWASPQSAVLPSREELAGRVAEIAGRFAGQEKIPRPPNWGGIRVVPEVIEFWQGQPSRLHDRLSFRRQSDGTWLMQRLAP